MTNEPITMKDLKVGDKAILKTYAGPVRVTVRKVGIKYLYVTRTNARFSRETGECPDFTSKRLLLVEQHEENVKAFARVTALRRWGIELKQPYDAEKLRKVYEALKYVFEEQAISGAG